VAPVGRLLRASAWRWLVATAVALSLAALPSCGWGEADHRVRLTVGTYWGGAAAEALQRELLGISAEIGDVTIDVRTFTLSGLSEYLFESQPGGGEGALDLVVVPNDWLGRLWQRRVIGEIPAARVERLQQSLVRQAMLTVTQEDEVLGLPVGAQVLGLVYDPALFPAPPRTMDEVIAAGRRNGVLPVALDLSDPYFIAPLVSSYEGLLVDQSGGLAWRDDVLLRVLRELAPAWDNPDGWRACRGADLESLQLQLFLEGRLASFLADPSMLSALEESHHAFAVQPVPRFADAPFEARALVGYQCVAVTRGSAWVDLALDVAERLCRLDVNERLSQSSRRLPVLLASYKTQAAMSSPGMVGYLQALEVGQLFPSDYRWSDEFQRVADRLQRLTVRARPPTLAELPSLLRGGGE
jgi:maltose-binding protein MalE